MAAIDSIATADAANVTRTPELLASMTARITDAAAAGQYFLLAEERDLNPSVYATLVADGYSVTRRAVINERELRQAAWLISWMPANAGGFAP